MIIISIVNRIIIVIMVYSVLNWLWYIYIYVTAITNYTPYYINCYIEYV